LNKLTYIGMLLVWCLSSTEAAFSANPGQVDVIQLTKVEDIRDASSMNAAIDGVSAKVKACVEGKLAPPSECFCLYPKELLNIRKIYEDTIKSHPSWKGKAVSYVQDGRTIVVSLSGVGRQLEKKCP